MKTPYPEFIIIRSREEWRDWLELNHNKEKEQWISIFRKKHAHKGLTYEDAVEEALCFGWIDGVMRSLDEEKFIQRFSPRRNKSPWSLRNKNKAEKMIGEGKMTEAGLKMIEEAKKNGWWGNAYSSKTEPEIPEDLKKAFKLYPKLSGRFRKMSNSDQFRYIYWLNNAKRTETREKRINEIIEKILKY